MRFVIIGTGRSGTKYCAHLLTAYGVPTSHEKRYRPTGQQPTHGMIGEASWLALPAIEAGDQPERVVHVVRDPRLAIRSMVIIGKFTRRTPWADFAREHCPSAYQPGLSVIESGCVFWEQWTERCDAVADATLRLEDVTVEVLMAACGVTEGRPRRNERPPSIQTNHRDAVYHTCPPLAWADLTPGVWRLAARLGYGL